MTVLVWLRQDLRISDNPALTAAVATAEPVVPVYVLDNASEGDWPIGAAQRWWLHQSLHALGESFNALGSRLVLRRGPVADELGQLRSQTGATAIFWNRRYEPAAIARDAAIKRSLRMCGVDAKSFDAGLLAEPWEIQNQSGKPFQVFTPYWRRCLQRDDPPRPAPALKAIATPNSWPRSLRLEQLGLMPAIAWYRKMDEHWRPGEKGAQRRLNTFLGAILPHYAASRNLPAMAGTSCLSPHLHFGEISARQVWHALHTRAVRDGIIDDTWRRHPFLTEIYWREFAYHLLYHFPRSPTEPLRPKFTSFPWENNAEHFDAWRRGRTGVPLVDAGMRQLWSIGWMHNRVRMVVGSFLVKNLLLSWVEGARWFWDTLVDADLANNTLGWQWCAGCGADAAPYFRIFNPVSQGETFDSDGNYVREWVPELAKLPTRYIHAPWKAPAAVLHAAKVDLGKTYPLPVADLKTTRERALSAYKALRGKG
jgi:deoxyribodipyrimidine photo-lyase